MILQFVIEIEVSASNSLMAAVPLRRMPTLPRVRGWFRAAAAEAESRRVVRSLSHSAPGRLESHGQRATASRGFCPRQT